MREEVDLTGMALFVRIVENGSLSAAGRDLGRESAAFDGERERPLHLFASADATRANDALGRVTPLAITKFIMIARRELDSHDSRDCALKTLASPN